MTTNKSKLSVLLTLLVIILLVIAGYFSFRTKAPQPISHNPVNINTTGQPTIGKANAPVHIIAFEDLKCSACRIYNNTLYPKIKKKYIDTGVAKYTYFNLAFIDGSVPAANAARCLYKQNKKYFFPFVEYVYHHQPPETDNWATVGKLLQFAKASNPSVNLDKLSSCIITGRYNTFVQKNLKTALTVMQGQIATPAIYINGVKLHSLTIEAVDQLVKRAKNKTTS